VSDWGWRIEFVAEELAWGTAYTLHDWMPAVRACWARGLTEREALDTCRSTRFPHVVAGVLSAMNAMKGPS